MLHFFQRYLAASRQFRCDRNNNINFYFFFSFVQWWIHSVAFQCPVVFEQKLQLFFLSCVQRKTAINTTFKLLIVHVHVELIFLCQFASNLLCHVLFRNSIWCLHKLHLICTSFFPLFLLNIRFDANILHWIYLRSRRRIIMHSLNVHTT